MFWDKWLDKGIVLVLALTASLPVMVSYNIVGDELLWYLSVAEQLAGVSVDGWYRLFVAVLNLLTALIAYVSFGKFFRSSPVGVLASGLVVLSPYRLYWLYQQSAIGICVVIMCLPLILWGLGRSGEKKLLLWKMVGTVSAVLGIAFGVLLELKARGANVVNPADFQTVGVDSALLLCVLVWIGLWLGGKKLEEGKNTLVYVLVAMALFFGTYRVNEILMNSGNLMFV